MKNNKIKKNKIPKKSFSLFKTSGNVNNNQSTNSISQGSKKGVLWLTSLVVGCSSVFVAGVSFFVYTATLNTTNNNSGNQLSPNESSDEPGDNSGDNSDSSSGSGSNSGMPNSTGDTGSGSSVESEASTATQWISERTLSLRFSYTVTSSNGSKSSYYEYGTGWVYYADESTNTFYIATNLHVAGIVSLVNKTVKDVLTTSSFPWGQRTSTITQTYTDLSSYVGFAQNLTGEEDNSAQIAYYSVDNPEIVYTTVTDESFNSTFNSTSNQYYGVLGNSLYGFDGISDIAILKYTLNPTSSTTVDFSNYNYYKLTTPTSSEAITNFKNWISTYFDNPTKIYRGYMENISSEYTSSLSMAGYPAYNIETKQSSSSGTIAWLPYSNFSIHTTYSPISEIGLKSQSQTYYSEPIKYMPDSKTTSSSVSDNYYMSIGLLSEITADSYSGASGSAVVANFGTSLNPDYQIVGIYWGAITYSSSVSYGAMTWFATNNYSISSSDIVSYNLTNTMDKVVGYIE